MHAEDQTLYNVASKPKMSIFFWPTTFTFNIVAALNPYETVLFFKRTRQWGTSEVPHQIPLLFPGESCQDSQNVWISSLKPFLWTHKISIWKCFVNFWEISHWSNLVSLDFVKKWPILNFKLHEQYAPQNIALFI